MPTVPTVAGEKDTSALGVTLMHEHIFILSPEMQSTFPGFMGWDEAAAIGAARERLVALKAAGVDSIVDITAPGLGRNVRLVAKTMQGIDLNVIVCTGYYTFDHLPHPFRFVGPGKLCDDPDDELLVSLFLRDIQEGIEGTGIRAGILKCCTDEAGVTADVGRVLHAVARAHQLTGVPISTHTHAPTKRGRDQQQIFRDAGIDLSRVVIGHCSETDDVDYLLELIDNGSYIGFDTGGLNTSLSTETKTGVLTQLCQRGLADRIVLSHDYNCWTDWYPEGTAEATQPGWDYNYVLGTLAPALLQNGVTRDQVDQMLVGNPRAIFSNNAAPA